MVIQTRVFRRLVERGSELRVATDRAIDEVVDEVNTFIAPLGDKCVNVTYSTTIVDAKGHTLFVGTVVYIE